MEEDGEKRRRPTVLYWDELSPSRDEEAPPVLAAVTGGNQKATATGIGGKQSQQCQNDDLRRLDDKQLNESIARIKCGIKTLSPRLADRGAKLSLALKRHEDERERRKRRRRVEQAEDNLDEWIIHKRYRMRSVRNCYQDVISELPSNITENILMRLPLRDAVRTSILSNNWRYKWATLPHLIFDDQLPQKSREIEKLKTIIYRVLLLHRGPILKFVLLGLPSCSDIDNWIIILSKNTIQEFTFYSITEHTLPSHFFSFMHLRSLRLCHCVFKPPPTFKGFNSLVRLDFHRVTVVPELFGNFISYCPLLERLKLTFCTSFDCLEITAPNLKHFKYRGAFKSIRLQDTSLLAKIAIVLNSMDSDDEWYHEQGEDFYVIDFLHCLPAIEKLNIDSGFLTFLALGGVPKSLAVTLNHLKVLDISIILGNGIDVLSCALYLIRSFPNLQKLQFSSIFANFDEDLVHVNFLQAHNFSSCSSNKLQNVTMRVEIDCLAPALELIKLLLAYSPVLEKMEIHFLGEVTCDVKLTMFKELIRYPRASPKAEIIYLD